MYTTISSVHNIMMFEKGEKKVKQKLFLYSLHVKVDNRLIHFKELTNVLRFKKFTCQGAS